MREHSYELYLGPELGKDAPREVQDEHSPTPEKRDLFTGKLMPGSHKGRTWDDFMDAEAQERAKRGWRNLERSQQKGVAPAAAIASTMRPIWMLDMEGNTLCWFESIADAFRKTGISNIGGVLSGKLKSAGGFKWEYDTSGRNRPMARASSQTPAQEGTQATHDLSSWGGKLELNSTIQRDKYYRLVDAAHVLGVAQSTIVRFWQRFRLETATVCNHTLYAGHALLALRRAIYHIADNQPVTPTTMRYNLTRCTNIHADIK